MTAEDFNSIDWSKLFMGFAVSVIMVIQAWHGAQIREVKKEVVPRAEYEQKHQVLKQDMIPRAEYEQKHEDLRQKIVPRAEYERKHDDLMHKDKIMPKSQIEAELNRLRDKIAELEGN